jgi:hypothetical protein
MGTAIHGNVDVEGGGLGLRSAALTEAGRCANAHRNESAPIVVRSACQCGFVTRQVNASEFLPH